MNLWTDFIQTCTGTYLGQLKGMIRFFMALTKFSRSLGSCKSEKALFALYLLNQWPDFEPTGRDTDTSLGGP